MATTESFFLDNSEYRLTPAQAKEVDAKNDEFPVTNEGNIAFNSWFRGFLSRNHIRPWNRRFSAYWSGAANSTDDTVKHALTLRAMRSVVNVIDPEHNLSVEFKSDFDRASWHGERVMLPSAPVEEMKDLHEAINLQSGFAIGEAMHAKYTKPIMTPRVTLFQEESELNASLLDLIEDERCERIEMQENPGFKSYLQRVQDYLWEKNPKSFGDWEDADPQQKLDGLVTGLRYADRNALPETWNPIIEQAKAIVDGYCDQPKPDPIAAVEALKKFIDLPPQDEQGESEDGSEDGGDNEGESQPGDGEPQPGEGKPQPGGCKLLPSDFVKNDRGMEGSTMRAVEDLVDQEVEKPPKESAMWEADADEMPEIMVLRPPAESKAVPPITGLLAKAKAAIEFRKAVPRADERFMRSGELDEDELYRLNQGDTRVFRDITEEVIPSATVYLLVDMSGSMGMFMDEVWPYKEESGETRISVAQKYATLLVTSMLSKPHVKVKVLGHTGDNDGVRSRDYGHGAAMFYRIWEEGDPIDRLSLIKTIRQGENYDSYAIAWAGHMLAQEDSDQKLMIVLSDGQPAGRNYGGTKAINHVARVRQTLERKGVDVIQISISDDLNEETQKRMFKHYIPAKGSGNEIYTSVLKQLQRLLLKISTR